MVPRPSPALAACALLALALAGCGEVKVEKRRRSGPDAAAVAAVSRERRLDAPRPVTSGGSHRQPDVAADGQSLVCLERPASGGEERILLLRSDGAQPRLLDTGGVRPFGPTLAPDGSGVLFAGAPAGAPPPGAPADPASPWPFDPSLDLYRCDLAGGRPAPLTATPGFDGDASWSWGGGKIVFTSWRDGESALWLVDSDGGSPRRLLAMPYAGSARISPDGSRVVFHAAAGPDRSETEIYVAPLDGGKPVALTALGAVSITPCWHPTQQAVLFASNAADRDFELWLARPDGGGVERVTFSPGFDGFPCFARDGKQLYWTSQRQGARAGQTQVWRAGWRD